MTENSLVPLNNENAVQYFTLNGLEPIIEKIRKEVKSFIPDTSSDKGRKEISSMARKVASAKVAIDDIGKELVAGWKNQAAVVDAERKRMRDVMDALRDETRQPLTEWEETEEKRTAKHQENIDHINAMMLVFSNITLPELRDRLDSLVKFDAMDFQEFSELARASIESTRNFLTDKIESVKKGEEDRVELERLRVAERDRQAKEAEEKTKREEQERAERLREEGAIKARQEAEQKAKAELERADRERRESEAREKRALDDAAAAKVKAESDRIAAEEKAKRDQETAVQAERDRSAAAKKAEEVEAAKREANKKHCAKINNEILEVLLKMGIAETTGKNLIKVIALNNLPHVKITY